MPSYPSGMSLSSRGLQLRAGALRRRQAQLRTRWRRLDAGHQAPRVVAYLRKGETYTDLACGFAVGVSTVYRYVKEGLALLADMGPTLEHAIGVAKVRGFAGIPLHVWAPYGVDR